MQRKLRAIAAALSCLVLAFAIITGLFQANTRYFYCESMGMMRDDPCAAAAATHRDEHQEHARTTTDELSRTPFSCCSTGILGALPSSTALDEARVAPAQLVGILSLPSPIDSWALAKAASEAPHIDRFRVPPRLAREVRIQSMVFLT
jgi:hypothetical protein